MNWTIRLAELADAAYLPQVEHSAGQRFLEVPALSSFAHGEDMPVAAHQRLILQGTEWVAVTEDGDCVAFLAAEAIDGELHIWELAVRADLQNMGIGSRLVEVATAFARRHRLTGLTLTTFADAPWNAPWYMRLGFEVCPESERLGSILQSERERGWPNRCAMRKPIEALPCTVVVGDREASAVDAFLSERIYEYNAKATGYHDGKLYAMTCRNAQGGIRAGISGYTWGGCCYVAHLWTAESERGLGLGTELLRQVEEYAQSKGCQLMLLASHSFQAPDFYRSQGYQTQAVVRDHPLGHSNVLLAKRLQSRPRVTPPDR